MARLPRLFRTHSRVPRKKISYLHIWENLGWFFFFIVNMVYCVLSLESPHRGDSNKNTRNTFMVKKNRKYNPIMPPDLALCLTLISSNYPCLEHLFLVPRCSSHWSSTVHVIKGGCAHLLSFFACFTTGAWSSSLKHFKILSSKVSNTNTVQNIYF